MVHFVENYLFQPRHRITVAVIGVGGTGTQVLTNLAQMNKVLLSLDHPGLYVEAYDFDTVDEANLGRQLFAESELGMNKAKAYITRINRFFGFDWEGYSRKLKEVKHNIVITCTDTIRSRLEISELINKNISSGNRLNIYNKLFYWLDFGNSQYSGQFILGSSYINQPESSTYEIKSKLKFCSEYFNYNNINEEDSGPSCSLAAAITQQDLFINGIIAKLGSDLLWKLFNNAFITYQGMFINLETNTFNPINI